MTGKLGSSGYSMSEEPLANKSRHTAPSDAEYDLIYATVSETAQGRRFLEEYARRCRPSDAETSLAAIERMQAVIRDGGTSERLQLLLEMADMAQAIVHLRAEILAMRPPGAGPLEATEELDSIVHTTESATSRILAAAENVQEIAWTMRDNGSIKALCDELDTQATEIYAACSFQDLTGQRTRKVIQVLRYVEDRINAVVAAQSGSTPREEKSSSANLLQAGVDAVMQPEASAREQDRQDATLEDISRLMLEIEPTIGLPESVSEKSVAQNVAARVEDIRPELSVAEAVIAEEDASRGLTDWAVNPPAAAKPAPETGLVDWVVEDPQAPQPEAEPAWMILRRLEAKDDEQPAEPTRPATDSSPPKAAPPAPAAEPGLFVAEAMSQLAQELRPASLLPPADLTFRSKLPQAEPLAVLASTLAAKEMKLTLPGDDAHEAATPVKQAPPEPSVLMQRATTIAATLAATATERKPAESDPDDFLFVPEEKPPAAIIARVNEPKTDKPTLPTAAPTQNVPPQPAPKTPEAESKQPKASDYDPLSPLRAMSDAQKIALFS